MWLQGETAETLFRLSRLQPLAQRVGVRLWVPRLAGAGAANQRQFLLDFEAGFAHQLGDRGGIQARGVEFDAHGAGLAVEAEMPDAVDVARTGQRRSHLLRGRGGVAIRESPPWS